MYIYIYTRICTRASRALDSFQRPEPSLAFLSRLRSLDKADIKFRKRKVDQESNQEGTNANQKKTWSTELQHRKHQPKK